MILHTDLEIALHILNSDGDPCSKHVNRDVMSSADDVLYACIER